MVESLSASREADAINQSLLLGQLIAAELHVGAVTRNLRHQQSLAEELERSGHDSRPARMALRRLQQMQALHLADRDRVRAELEGVRARLEGGARCEGPGPRFPPGLL